MSNTENIFLKSSNENYLRFSKEELEQQRIDLLFYIITELSSSNISSLQESIKEIKALTGINISLEKAIELKQLANHPTTSAKEKKKQKQDKTQAK